MTSEWRCPGFTLEQKQAAIVKSITVIGIHPAPRLGAKFSLDQLTIVWETDDTDTR